jgi:hypothetical protein
MKMRSKLTPAILGLAVAGLMSAGVADAATTIKGDVVTFTKNDPHALLNARPDSFYNLDMGYKGWTHFSSWGNVKLIKGSLYTITVELANPTVDIGFHPAVAVWYRPQGSGLVPNTYAYDHFYNQWANIIAKNVTDEADNKKLGTFKQYFVVNGVDRDGWDATDPDIFDQGNVVRILDGAPGKVQVQFVAKDSGWYQFVVGGINPNPPLDTKPAKDLKYAVNVTVGGL